MAETQTDAATTGRMVFAGQPRGLSTLFFTELWERFSYYGMRALLTLFVVTPVATGGLGLTSVEQNEVIRVLTVAATFFFPPTLVGTVYGMNFEWMPELGWRFGYPLALLAMVVSVIIPYIYFKRKGWL